MRMKNFLCMILTATRNAARMLGLEDQPDDIPALRVAAEVFSP